MTEYKDLSEEQKRVVDSWGEGLAVMAGAGSGKTTTLVIKCGELLKQRPDAKFAAVSFTERSASDLREKLSARLPLAGEGGALSGHWVMTIHGLCNAVIRENPRAAGLDGEEMMLSEADSMLLWERSIESLWFEDLPLPVLSALDVILNRESRSSLLGLLSRMRSLHSFGVLGYLNNQGGDSTALATIGGYVLDRYERLKRRRGALDFDDLERCADRALEKKDVREGYRRRFDLVLVDEFQDTNPVQARIITKFSKADSSNLCVVGDPKQSIYRFRDADVSVFTEFCEKMPKSLSLTYNFRSRPGIIDFSNEVCAPAFEASKMEYQPLVPKRESLGEAVVERLDVQSPSELAAWIKGQVAAGVKLGSMALLLRKIRGNENWLRALTSSGIPIAVGSGGLFWEDPRVRELTAFLKWWNDPSNRLSGAAFLRAPWVGIDDKILDQWISGGDLEEHFFRSEHRLTAALKKLRGRFVRPGELLLALLEFSEIEHELGASAIGLWHRVEELTTKGLGFSAVVRELSMAMEESRRERDVPPPRSSGQLSVLTLHASKGLEFEHVILVDFKPKPARASEAPLLYWDREKGAYLAPRTEDGERDKKNPTEQSWRSEEKEKNLAESKRVFYVALTRARERLVLVFPQAPTDEKPKKKLDDPKNEAGPYGSDFWRGWIEAARAVAKAEKLPFSDQSTAFSAVSDYLKICNGQEIGIKRPRHSVTEWNTLARCPLAYELTYIRPKATDLENKKTFFEQADEADMPETRLSQREIGTRVHECLEKGDYEALREIEKEAGVGRFVANNVAGWAKASPCMQPSAPETGRQVFTELAFEAPVSGEVLVGSLDRLIVEESSAGPHFTIVDFKITAHVKSAEQLRETYSKQIELYAWGLRQLDPRSNAGNTKAVLVNISGRRVNEVEVEIPEELDISSLACEAARIVSGGHGECKTGGCELCKELTQTPTAL